MCIFKYHLIIIIDASLLFHELRNGILTDAFLQQVKRLFSKKNEYFSSNLRQSNNCFGIYIYITYIYEGLKF